MKKFKKIVCILLSLTMLMTMNVPTLAASRTAMPNDTADSGFCGGNVKWNLTGDGTLTISGNGAMDDYSSYMDSPWYGLRIENIEITSGVTHIGNYAFALCKDLKNVSIPDTVKAIGIGAFYNCENLKGITISNSVETIDDYAFYYCYRLESVEIGSSVKRIGKYSFAQCSSLKVVYCPKSVMIIDDCAFGWCIGMTDIYIANANCVISDNENTIYSDTKIHADNNSTAQEYADKHGNSFVEYDGTTITFSKDEYEAKVGEEFPLSGELFAPNGTSGITLKWSVTDENGISVNTPASMLNTDANHIIFSTLATGIKGGQYTVTVETSNGAKSICRVIVSSYDNAYITEHIDFVNSKTYDNLVKNKTSLSVIDKDKFNDSIANLTAWDLIGDVGKIASLKFDDLLLCNNPFDIVLADLINSYVATSTINSAITTEAFKTYNSTFEKLMDTLKSTEEWDNSISTKIEIEVKGILTDPDYKIQDSNAFSVFKKALKNIDDDNIESIFSGFNCASKISKAISEIGDIADGFIEAYNAYVTASAFQKVGKDFVKTLIIIAYERLWADPIRSDYFIESINKLLELFDGESAFDYALKNLRKSMFFKAYDMVGSELLKNLAYSFISNAFGCTPGSVGIVVFAYNTTYSVLNFLTANGDKADLIYLLDAARYLEDGLLSQLNSSTSALIKSQELKNAQLLDCHWGMLQSVESYLFQTLSQYQSKLKTKTRIFKTFNKSYTTDEMEYALSLATDWKNAKCHNGSYSNDIFEYIIKCPTDVFVYGNDSELLLKITNNTVNYCNEQILAFVIDDEKYFSIPINVGKKINVIGTDEGSMSYKIIETDGSDLIRCVEYNDVPLNLGCKYSTVIPETTYQDNETYNLKSDNGKIITCDYDSLISNEEKCRYVIETYTMDIDGQYIYTSETKWGKSDEFITLNPDVKNGFKLNYSSSILSGRICKDNYLTLKVYIDRLKYKLSFSMNDHVISQTLYFGSQITIPDIADKDGYIFKQWVPTPPKTMPASDLNIEALYEKVSDETDFCSHNCHKGGFMGFIWKIINFFNKLFRSKQYCSCGAKHW